MKFLSLLPVSILFVAATASAQFSTGFETPTYTSGIINGQDSWSTSTPAVPRVLTSSEIAGELTTLGLNSTTPVHGGSQAFFISGTNSASSSSFRTISGLTSANVVQLDVWARPLSGAGSLGNIFLTMEDNVAGGTRAAAFRFGTQFGNTIDYGTTVSGIWQSSGITWDSDSWYHLSMTANYTTKTYSFSINDVLIGNSITFYSTASANLSQVRVFRGANNVGMIVDDLSVVAVPEPTTCAGLVMGVGLLFLQWKLFPKNADKI